MRSALLVGGAILSVASVGWAQEATSRPVGDTATGDTAALATQVALTGALIVTSATGALLIGTPTGWPQTWSGFGYRVADQTGFYLVQTSSVHALGRAMGYRPDGSHCPRRTLVTCAVTATFSAFDREGRRRVNVPLVTSILVGTGLSLLWRPERRAAGESWAFVGTRIGITVGGYVAERMLVDAWAQRTAPAPGERERSRR